MIWKKRKKIEIYSQSNKKWKKNMTKVKWEKNRDAFAWYKFRQNRFSKNGDTGMAEQTEIV